MLNERDGGIGRGKTRHPRTPGRDDAQKDVQCHDSVKGRNPVVITPYSTRNHGAAHPQGGGRQVRFVMASPLRLTGNCSRGLPIPTGTARRRSYDTSLTSRAALLSLRARRLASCILMHHTAKSQNPLSQALANDYGYTGHAAPGLHQPSVQNQITRVKSRYEIETQN